MEILRLPHVRDTWIIIQADELEHGVPHLPAGCHIQLEKEARRWILENIKGAITSGLQAMSISRIVSFVNEFRKGIVADLSSELGVSIKNVVGVIASAKRTYESPVER